MSSTLIDTRRSAFVLPPDHVLSSSMKMQHATINLQALTDTTHNSKQDSTSTCAPTYVHPLVKKLSRKLSEKSLEMCTESLGSETGSDFINDLVNYSPSVILHRKEIKVAAKTKREYNFPPPLTSIDDSISMESYRENGRLVMKAVVLTETSGSLFYAERINGRLMLRLRKGDLEEGDINEDQDDDNLNGCNESVEGNIGIDENLAMLGRCIETGGERRREGYLWNMETCCVVT